MDLFLVPVATAAEAAGFVESASLHLYAIAVCQVDGEAPADLQIHSAGQRLQADDAARSKAAVAAVSAGW